MAYLTHFSNNIPVIRFPIELEHMTIGQHIDTDICIAEDGIADNHASLETVKKSGSFRFVIKSSENQSAVQVNGVKVENSELKDGDWLLIGDVELQFTDDGVNELKVVSGKQINKVVAAPVIEIQPKLVKKETKLNVEEEESPALKIIREIREEVEALSTDNIVEVKHFSRRLNLF